MQQVQNARSRWDAAALYLGNLRSDREAGCSAAERESQVLVSLRIEIQVRRRKLHVVGLIAKAIGIIGGQGGSLTSAGSFQAAGLGIERNGEQVGFVQLLVGRVPGEADGPVLNC